MGVLEGEPIMEPYDHDVVPVVPYLAGVTYFLSFVIFGAYFGAWLPFL